MLEVNIGTMVVDVVEVTVLVGLEVDVGVVVGLGSVDVVEVTVVGVVVDLGSLDVVEVTVL